MVKAKKKIAENVCGTIPDLESQFNEIMEEFDFETVYNYMKGVSWEMNVNGKFKVPTLSELKQLAKNQLRGVMSRYDENKYVYTHSGPFKASCRYGVLELECIIEYWSCD